MKKEQLHFHSHSCFSFWLLNSSHMRPISLFRMHQALGPLHMLFSMPRKLSSHSVSSWLIPTHPPSLRRNTISSSVTHGLLLPLLPLLFFIHFVTDCNWIFICVITCSVSVFSINHHIHPKSRAMPALFISMSTVHFKY